MSESKSVNDYSDFLISAMTKVAQLSIPLVKKQALKTFTVLE